MKTYKVTPHAINRAVERLGVSAEQAKNHLTQLMQTAYYNGDTTHPSGTVMRIYDHHKSRTRLIVAPDDTIITVYKVTDLFDIPEVLSVKVTELFKRELAKFERIERKLTRSNTLLKAELQVELAELNLRLLRARSQATKNACQARINAINERIAELDEEIIEAKRNKSIIAKGVAAYL
jgi:hypothetical protein